MNKDPELLNRFIYKNKIALVDFGGNKPGHDKDKDPTQLAFIIGAATVALAIVENIH